MVTQYQRDYQKKRYHDKLDESRKRAVSKNKKSRDRNRKYVLDYLSSHPCIDCGEADIVVLEFDHVRGEKSKDISQLIVGCSIERIQEEIDKCDVRCANCHRRKTFERNKCYRNIGG